MSSTCHFTKEMAQNTFVVRKLFMHSSWKSRKKMLHDIFLEKQDYHQNNIKQSISRDIDYPQNVILTKIFSVEKLPHLVGTICFSQSFTWRGRMGTRQVAGGHARVSKTIRMGPKKPSRGVYVGKWTHTPVYMYRLWAKE